MALTSAVEGPALRTKLQDISMYISDISLSLLLYIYKFISGSLRQCLIKAQCDSMGDLGLNCV